MTAKITRVLGLLAALTPPYAVFLLLRRDSALCNNLSLLLFGRPPRALILPLLLTAAAFLIQWYLLRSGSPGQRRLPLAVCLPGLALTELLYRRLGEDGALWAMLLLPVFGALCLGALLALAVDWARRQPKPLRRTAAGIAVVLLALCLWAWPRTVSSRITPAFDGTMAYYKNGSMAREVQLDERHVNTIFRYYTLSPTFREQDWTREDAIALRLNDDYLLLAPRDGDPCVYAYTGDPADFALTRPKWVIYRRTYCYEELLSCSTGW